MQRTASGKFSQPRTRPPVNPKNNSSKVVHLRRRRRSVPWYYDVRIWLPVFMLVLLTSHCPLSRPAAQDNENAMQGDNLYTEDVTPTQAASEPLQAATEPTAPVKIVDADAVSLARLADTVAGSKSDKVKEIIMWIAINRVEDTQHGYGGTLEAEIARPNQWQCYDPDSYYTENTYAIALSVVDSWRNRGPRPIYNDMLWFKFNGDGSITIRNQFKSEKNRVELTFE